MFLVAKHRGGSFPVPVGELFVMKYQAEEFALSQSKENLGLQFKVYELKLLSFYDSAIETVRGEPETSP